MLKHVPGPWRVETMKSGYMISAGPRDPKDPRVCDYTRIVRGAGGIRREADARLICAAPDLLAALEELIGLEVEAINGSRGGECGVARVSGAFIRARAAIAKARGAA